MSRDGLTPTVRQDDLRKGAAHQLRGRLAMVDFDRRIVPTRGLDTGTQGHRDAGREGGGSADEGLDVYRGGWLGLLHQ